MHLESELAVDLLDLIINSDYEPKPELVGLNFEQHFSEFADKMKNCLCNFSMAQNYSIQAYSESSERYSQNDG